MVFNCSICGKVIGQYELSFALTIEQSRFTRENELEVLEADELKRWCQNCDYETMLSEKISIIHKAAIRELAF